jgi:hypothetical protein
VVFDIDREEVVLNEALEDAQARGVVFDIGSGDRATRTRPASFPRRRRASFGSCRSPRSH